MKINFSSLQVPYRSINFESDEIYEINGMYVTDVKNYPSKFMNP